MGEWGRSPTLGDLALSQVAHHLPQFLPELHSIPASTVSDIFHQVTKGGELDDLLLLLVKRELSDLNLFLRLLKIPEKRVELCGVVQALGDWQLGAGLSFHHKETPLVTEILAESFASQAKEEHWLKSGFLLGNFLLHTGWFAEAATVWKACVALCSSERAERDRLFSMERLLVAQSAHFLVTEARDTYNAALDLLDKLGGEEDEEWEEDMYLSRSSLYNAFSMYHYNESRYNEALDWSQKALKMLQKAEACSCSFRGQTSAKNVILTAIDVLKQAAVTCSVKRQIKKAKLLISKALHLAKTFCGARSAKYGDVLLSYGFYLMTSDNFIKGVEVYLESFLLKKSIYGIHNVYTAIAQTELAYSLYVREYNTGKFDEARGYVEQAMDTMVRVLPEDHVLNASSKRVMALILEEIAIDSVGTPAEQELLILAEKIHLSCIKLTGNVFGELNVQTAKHYGNLGRLYQTMKKYRDAEAMHLKAISIKETLLGASDYEVGLSVGHLASLYNYDMRDWRKAEELHLRSIEIGRNLFGESYSGLEYDFRGLIQAYIMLEDNDKYLEYTHRLLRWKILRDEKEAELEEEGKEEARSPKPLSSISGVINEYFHQD